MAFTVTWSQSCRATLGCVGMGGSHHGRAASKSGATVWGYHFNIDKNLRGSTLLNLYHRELRQFWPQRCTSDSLFRSSKSPRTWLCKNMNVTQLVKHFGQNQPHNGEKRKYKSSSSSSSSSLGTAKVCLKYNNNLSIWFCWVYRRQNRGNKPGAASPAWLLTLILTSFDKISKSVRFLGKV